MGLDVYMYRIENLEKTLSKEKAYERISNEMWKNITGDKEYKNTPEEEIELWKKETDKIKIAMNLDEYGNDKSRESISLDSQKYPDHLFKIGYFRSSYNDSGFNSIIRNFIDSDLYSIFPTEADNYEFTPDWNQSKDLAVEMLLELQIKTKQNPFRAISINNYVKKDQPTSGKEALEIFLEEQKTHTDNTFRDYSSSKGTFYLSNPIKTYGIIEGKNLINDNCTYLIIDYDYSWYIQALEIVIETIEWVLQKDDPQNYCLSWSG